MKGILFQDCWIVFDSLASLTEEEFELVESWKEASLELYRLDKDKLLDKSIAGGRAFRAPSEGFGCKDANYFSVFIDRDDAYKYASNNPIFLSGVRAVSEAFYLEVPVIEFDTFELTEYLQNLESEDLFIFADYQGNRFYFDRSCSRDQLYSWFAKA